MPVHQNYTFRKGPKETGRARIVMIARALRLIPMTVYELAEMVGTDRRTVIVYLAYLRGDMRAHRRFRIVEWRRNTETSGMATALYGRGTEPDEPRPTPYTKAEVSRRVRARNPELYRQRRRERVAVEREQRRAKVRLALATSEAERQQRLQAALAAAALLADVDMRSPAEVAMSPRRRRDFRARSDMVRASRLQVADDALEDLLDAEVAAMARSLVPRRDSMIEAFYGPAPNQRHEQQTSDSTR